MNIADNLSKILFNAFKKAGYDLEECKVVLCTLNGFGDFQCNDAMQIAKIYKKAPFLIAEDVIEFVENDDVIEKIEVVKPGFINIFVKNSYLSSFIVDYLDNFENNIKVKSQNILIDYGGPNAAKPLHVGHLRSAIIGESVKRICKFVGHNVLGDVHLGDWGLQMGLVIAEIELEHPDYVYFDDNFNGEYPKSALFTSEDLEKIYPKASARSKEDEKFLEKARHATYLLQNGKKGYVALWKNFIKSSIDYIKNIYDDLNVSFDLWLGESDSQPYVQPMIEYLKQKGFAKQSNGALIVDIARPDDKIEVPPVMLVKSDGSILYHTTELATLIQREKQFDLDRIIYLADNRQSLHFMQVFRCVEKTKLLNKNIKLDYIGFGTMNGKDGKAFKTRSGDVFKLETLIAQLKEKAKEKVLARENSSLDEKEIQNISNVVALSAIKFADLSNYRTKDYIFDVDKFCSFEGKTGPYILYTITRIKSLLKKCPNYDLKHDDLIIFDDCEKQILMHLSQLDIYVMNSYNDLAPSFLCDYAYNLANLYSTFYAKTNISKESDQQKQKSWIVLSKLCLNVLEKIMDLLGILTLDKM